MNISLAEILFGINGQGFDPFHGSNLKVLPQLSGGNFQEILERICNDRTSALHVNAPAGEGESKEILSHFLTALTTRQNSENITSFQNQIISNPQSFVEISYGALDGLESNSIPVLPKDILGNILPDYFREQHKIEAPVPLKELPPKALPSDYNSALHRLRFSGEQPVRNGDKSILLKEIIEAVPKSNEWCKEILDVLRRAAGKQVIIPITGMGQGIDTNTKISDNEKSFKDFQFPDFAIMSAAAHSSKIRFHLDEVLKNPGDNNNIYIPISIPGMPDDIPYAAQIPIKAVLDDEKHKGDSSYLPAALVPMKGKETLSVNTGSFTALTLLPDEVQEEIKSHIADKTAIKYDKTAVKYDKTTVKYDKTALSEPVQRKVLNAFAAISLDPHDIYAKDDKKVIHNILTHLANTLKNGLTVITEGAEEPVVLRLNLAAVKNQGAASLKRGENETIVTLPVEVLDAPSMNVRKAESGADDYTIGKMLVEDEVFLSEITRGDYSSISISGSLDSFDDSDWDSELPSTEFKGLNYSKGSIGNTSEIKEKSGSDDFPKNGEGKILIDKAQFTVDERVVAAVRSNGSAEESLTLPVKLIQSSDQIPVNNRESVKEIIWDFTFHVDPERGFTLYPVPVKNGEAVPAEYSIETAHSQQPHFGADSELIHFSASVSPPKYSGEQHPDTTLKDINLGEMSKRLAEIIENAFRESSGLKNDIQLSVNSAQIERIFTLSEGEFPTSAVLPAVLKPESDIPGLTGQAENTKPEIPIFIKLPGSIIEFIASSVQPDEYQEPGKGHAVFQVGEGGSEPKSIEKNISHSEIGTVKIEFVIPNLLSEFPADNNKGRIETSGIPVSQSNQTTENIEFNSPQYIPFPEKTLTEKPSPEPSDPRILNLESKSGVKPAYTYNKIEQKAGSGESVGNTKQDNYEGQRFQINSEKYDNYTKDMRGESEKPAGQKLENIKIADIPRDSIIRSGQIPGIADKAQKSQAALSQEMFVEYQTDRKVFAESAFGDVRSEVGDRKSKSGEDILNSGTYAKSSFVKESSQSGSFFMEHLKPYSKIVEQNIDPIIQHVKFMKREGLTELRMELNPPELGKVLIRLSAVHSKMVAYIGVESHAIKAMFDEMLPKLQDSMTNNGVQIERLDVFVRDDNDPSSQHMFEQANKRNHGSNEKVAPADSNTEKERNESARKSRDMGYNSWEMVV